MNIKLGAKDLFAPNIIESIVGVRRYFMTDILKNVLNIAARIHDMQAAGTLAMAFFGIVLVFGLVNCILGYRLLRFWMMIFGFLMGAGAGFFGVYEAGASDKTIYVVVMLIAGVVLAVISFAIFKAGIFYHRCRNWADSNHLPDPSYHILYLFPVPADRCGAWFSCPSL